MKGPSAEVFYQDIDTYSKLGHLIVAANKNGLVFVGYKDSKYSEIKKDWKKGEHPLIHQFSAELQEYLRGERREFDVPLDVGNHTDFRQSMWKQLPKHVPYGHKVSFSEFQQLINKHSSKGADGEHHVLRAIGGAFSHNPIVIVIPCHRIGKKSGKDGYQGGTERKKFLQNLEKDNLNKPEKKEKKEKKEKSKKREREGIDDSDGHSNLPICTYGADCYRKNPEHRKKYYHPKKKKEEKE